MKIMKLVPDLAPTKTPITAIPFGQPFTASFKPAHVNGKELYGTFMRIKYPTTDAHYAVCLESGTFYYLPYDGSVTNYKLFEASELVLKEK